MGNPEKYYQIIEDDLEKDYQDWLQSLDGEYDLLTEEEFRRAYAEGQCEDARASIDEDLSAKGQGR